MPIVALLCLYIFLVDRSQDVLQTTEVLNFFLLQYKMAETSCPVPRPALKIVGKDYPGMNVIRKCVIRLD